jgi:hypothetical protein
MNNLRLILTNRLISQSLLLYDFWHWIDLARNRDQWSALVNTEMNLRVS